MEGGKRSRIGLPALSQTAAHGTFKKPPHDASLPLPHTHLVSKNSLGASYPGYKRRAGGHGNSHHRAPPEHRFAIAGRQPYIK